MVRGTGQKHLPKFFKGEAMYFLSKYHCNAEWSSDPEVCMVKLDASWEQKIKDAQDALLRLDANIMIFWWAAGYEFYDEDGKVFEPDYSIDGCEIKVHKDGSFKGRFQFKHSNEEGWTDDFKWSDGVKKFTKKDLVKKFKEAA